MTKNAPDMPGAPYRELHRSESLAGLQAHQEQARTPSVTAACGLSALAATRGPPAQQVSTLPCTLAQLVRPCH